MVSAPIVSQLSSICLYYHQLSLNQSNLSTVTATTAVIEIVDVNAVVFINDLYDRHFLKRINDKCQTQCIVRHQPSE